MACPLALKMLPVVRGYSSLKAFMRLLPNKDERATWVYEIVLAVCIGSLVFPASYIQNHSNFPPVLAFIIMSVMVIAAVSMMFRKHLKRTFELEKRGKSELPPPNAKRPPPI